MNKVILEARQFPMRRIRIDAVVVGCGAAGLYTALSLDTRLNCAILCKTNPDISNSMYAQGGISAVTQRSEPLRASHVADTLTAGAGLCDMAAVQVLVSEAADNIERLIALGVPFDRENGDLARTREGGHSERRVLHCGGDATGLHLTSTLLERAKQRANIRFYDAAQLTDILYDAHGVTGVLALCEDMPTIFETRRVILATGGIGRVYNASTNATCATGDGMAAAARAGLPLQNMEFVQFHPTALVGADQTGRSFLISEAIRGEGGKLINNQGEYFMQDVHPMADLAPRDIVARAILREMRRTGESKVYLRLPDKPRAYLEKRFPTIYAECTRQGYDIPAEPIPVHPVQHYMMGGIQTGLFGETALPGLYACGETACTGVHGANRLGSNSLLECIVFGNRAAQHCADLMLPAAQAQYEAAAATVPEAPATRAVPAAPPLLDYVQTGEAIRGIMSTYCGASRDAEGLSRAIASLKEFEETLLAAPIRTTAAVETLNIAQIALAVATAAYARKDSVGAHYRSDGAPPHHPGNGDDTLCHSIHGAGDHDGHSEF
ncbi:MAG TPA: L-aspartate oxidase [Firmicutes bacterium]|nr:L-aspartate oxidase [Bacillota bacterium]